MTEGPVRESSEHDLLVLKGLEGNPSAGELSAGQRLILPYSNDIVLFWWIVWIFVLGNMIARNVLGAIRRRKKG